MFDEGDLREAVQIAILDKEPVRALRQLRAGREWAALYPTFADALRALALDEALIATVESE